MSDLPERIETIEDIRRVLAEVRAQLVEVSQMDLTDPDAQMLVEPLLELRASLVKMERDIREVMDDRATDG